MNRFHGVPFLILLSLLNGVLSLSGIICNGVEPQDITPQTTLNSDVIAPANGKAEVELKVTIEKYCDFPEAGKEGVLITIISPIYNSTIEKPDPSSPIKDDIEHVHIFFANEDLDPATQIPRYRISDIKFNRFWQKELKLLSVPYNIQRNDLSNKLEMEIVSNELDSWTGKIAIEVELLPAMFKRIAVFSVDATQEIEFDRYISTYRLYNHPISTLDLQVVTNYHQFTNTELENIVNEEYPSYTDYSNYWNNLNYGQ